MQTEYSKFFPDSLVLESSRVQLRLLQLEDLEDLQKISGPAEIWTYFSKKLSEPSALQQWIKDALEERKQEKRMPFVIIDKESNTICGSTSFGSFSFYDKRLEIGWTWLGTASMGTGINHHAKYVLLSFAFEVLKAERIEIKTDNLNARAKKALVHIGATEEGVFRNHMLMPEGRRRDSVYFSIIKKEWPDVQLLYFSDMG
jgi:N-acetyltransferase